MSNLKRTISIQEKGSVAQPYKKKRSYKPRKQNMTTMIRRVINRTQEHKEITNGQGGVAVLAGSGTTYSLCSVSEGADYTNRVGRKICWNKLYFAIAAQVASANTSNVAAIDQITVAIWHVKTPNQALPGYSTLFDTQVASGIASTYNGFAHKNTYQQDINNRVIWMETFALDIGNQCKFVRGVLDLQKILGEFPCMAEFGTAGTGIPVSNGLFLSFATSNSANISTANLVSFNIKTTFTDL